MNPTHPSYPLLEDCFSEESFSTLWSMAGMAGDEVSGRERRDLNPEERTLIERLAAGSAPANDRKRAAELMADNSLALEHFASLIHGRSGGR